MIAKVSCAFPNLFHICPLRANHGGHGCIDDHIARNVQVGDAFVRIHHGHVWAVFHRRLDVGFNSLALLLGQFTNLAEHIAPVRCWDWLLQPLKLLRAFQILPRNKRERHAQK